MTTTESGDGACPTCGRVLAPVKPAGTVTAKNLDLKRLAAGVGEDEDVPPTPWHFKLLMVLLFLYLACRLVDWLIL